MAYSNSIFFSAGDSNNAFAIQSDGKVVLLKEIDYDTMGDNKTINFEAIVSDGKNQATAIVQITVTDVSDVKLDCYPSHIVISVVENISTDTAILELNCTTDSNLNFSIKTGNMNNAFEMRGNYLIVNDSNGLGY